MPQLMRFTASPAIKGSLDDAGQETLFAAINEHGGQACVSRWSCSVALGSAPQAALLVPGVATFLKQPFHLEMIAPHRAGPRHQGTTRARSGRRMPRA